MSQYIFTLADTKAVALAAFNANFTEVYTTLGTQGTAISNETTARIAADSSLATSIAGKSPITGSSFIVTTGSLTSGSTGAGFIVDFGVASLQNVVPGANGGTGVVNTGALVFGNSTLTWAGDFNATFTLTGATNITLPTSGTLVAGATAVGQNIVSLTNPSEITFIRVNADNSVTALDAATYRTAIGAGTSNFDPANPGNIGTGTPGTGAFSGALAVGSQVVVNTNWAFYDFRVQLPSNGEISFTGVVLNSATGKDMKILRPAPKTIEITAGDLTNADTGIILASPDGTRYRVTVANGGAVTSTAA